jgi:hypothetical protein
VQITFVKVAATSETYKWYITNIQNPPSTQISSPFSDLIVYDKLGYTVQ